MSGPTEIVVTLAAIGYVLARRVAGEPAQAKRLLVLPAVLVGIGLSDLSGVATSLSLGFLAATATLSVVLGTLRGLSVRISQREGLAFVRYTWVAVVLWLVNLTIKFGGDLVLGVIDPRDASMVGNSVLLTLGLGILAEGLVVLYRALRGEHRVMWSTGRDGARHQMSPTRDGRAAEWNTRSNRHQYHR